jgi:hypothetical protein
VEGTEAEDGGGEFGEDGEESKGNEEEEEDEYDDDDGEEEKEDRGTPKHTRWMGKQRKDRHPKRPKRKLGALTGMHNCLWLASSFDGETTVSNTASSGGASVASRPRRGRRSLCDADIMRTIPLLFPLASRPSVRQQKKIVLEYVHRLYLLLQLLLQRQAGG